MTITPIRATTVHATSALQAACSLTGEAMPQPIRARLVALAALQQAFPHQNAKVLAELIGMPIATAGGAVRKAREHKNWWREDWVDEVVGALVAERYGEQAQ